MSLRLLKYLWLIIILILLSSCKEEKKGGGAEIDVNNITEISVWDVFSDIEIIPLETADESMLVFPIGEPDKMIHHGGKFYFLDEQQQSIFIFNQDGTFDMKFKRHGRGPAEYLILTDFNINRFTGDLELLSAMGYVMVYDTVSWKYKMKIELPEDIPAVHRFYNLTRDINVYYSFSNDDAKMILYSIPENKVIDKFYDIPSWLTMNTTLEDKKTVFYLHEDTVRFVQGYDGRVFNVSPSKPYLTERYRWDFGSKNLELEKIPVDRDIPYYLDFVKKASNDYVMQFKLNKENDSKYITRFKYRNRPHTLLYHKNSGDYIIFDGFREGIQCLPVWMDDEAIYACTVPEFLHFIVKTEVLKEDDSDKFKKLQPEDNPVIVKYYFR